MVFTRDGSKPIVTIIGTIPATYMGMNQYPLTRGYFHQLLVVNGDINQLLIAYTGC
jgi:hypothetical protein